ncbi:hypothetical protein AHAS_Ahas15G0127200 [Arachis hypogaea]
MAVREALKEFPEVVRLEALVEVENEASQRVLHKVGFHKEALLLNLPPPSSTPRFAATILVMS